MFTPEAEEFLVKRLGNALRRFRDSRELSQELFAAKLGCSRRQLSDIENGYSTTSFLFLSALLALMKDQTWLDFLHHYIPDVRQILNIEPLRSKATYLGDEPRPSHSSPSSDGRKQL